MRYPKKDELWYWSEPYSEVLKEDVLGLAVLALFPITNPKLLDIAYVNGGPFKILIHKECWEKEYKWSL